MLHGQLNVKLDYIYWYDLFKGIHNTLFSMEI